MGIPPRRVRLELWKCLDKAGFTKPTEENLDRLNGFFFFPHDLKRTQEEISAEQTAKFSKLSSSDKRLFQLIGSVDRLVYWNYLQKSREFSRKGDEHPGHAKFMERINEQAFDPNWGGEEVGPKDRERIRHHAQSHLLEIEAAKKDRAKYPEREVKKKLRQLQSLASSVNRLLAEFLTSRSLWQALPPVVAAIGAKRDPQIVVIPADFIRELRQRLSELVSCRT